MPLFDDLRLKSRDGKFLFGFLIAIIFICFIAWQVSGRDLSEELSSGGPIITKDTHSAEYVANEIRKIEAQKRENEELLREIDKIEKQIKFLEEEIRKEELRQSI